jgi:ribosomal protein S18 acetylase RimI-like enzyme
MIAVTPTAAAPRVRVRPLTPSDRDLIARVFDGLSPRSRLLRFLSPMPRLPRRTLDVLAAVDGSKHAAWVALSGDEPVGVVRWVRDGDDPTRAEIAIEVVDAHQGRGIGRTLTDAAVKGAAERGVERLTYDVDPANAPAIALVGGYTTQMRYEDGLLTGEIATPAPARRRFASSSRRRTARLRPILGTPL